MIIIYLLLISKVLTKAHHKATCRSASKGEEKGGEGRK